MDFILVSAFPEEVQQQLEEVRRTINHIGFYPGPSGITFCKDELAKYKGAKGSVQFPLNQPTPLEIVEEIVLFRVREYS